MAWKETCAVHERMLFVSDWERDEVSFSELCRHYAISRVDADRE